MTIIDISSEHSLLVMNQKFSVDQHDLRSHAEESPVLSPVCCPPGCGSMRGR